MVSIRELVERVSLDLELTGGRVVRVQGTIHVWPSARRIFVQAHPGEDYVRNPSDLLAQAVVDGRLGSELVRAGVQDQWEVRAAA